MSCSSADIRDRLCGVDPFCFVITSLTESLVLQALPPIPKHLCGVHPGGYFPGLLVWIPGGSRLLQVGQVRAIRVGVCPCPADPYVCVYVVDGWGGWVVGVGSSGRYCDISQMSCFQAALMCMYSGGDTGVCVCGACK